MKNNNYFYLKETCKTSKSSPHGVENLWKIDTL
jgi:hypothetical protein